MSKKFLLNYTKILKNLSDLQNQYEALMIAVEQWVDDETLDKIANTMNDYCKKKNTETSEDDK